MIILSAELEQFPFKALSTKCCSCQDKQTDKNILELKSEDIGLQQRTAAQTKELHLQKGKIIFTEVH